MRLGRFTLRHRTLGGLLHRLLHRRGACVVCRGVWAILDAEPGFRQRLQKGIDDHKAGRYYVRGADDWVKGPDWPDDAA